MRKEIRIVMADDHPIVRHGLRRVIERDAGICVVAEADDGAAALALIRTHTPEVAVLDIDMPQLDGFGVVRAMQRERITTTHVIFLTMHHEEEILHAALDLGVKGYVLKESAVSDIVNSIKTVALGRPYLSPSLSDVLLRMRQRPTPAASDPLQTLTPSERRVLQLIAQEQSTRDIAAQLFISPRTVDTHRANICKKLELHGNMALVKFALKHKNTL